MGEAPMPRRGSTPRMTWTQVYTPVGGSLLASALVAAIPVVVLLGLLGVFHVRAHLAALLGLAAALLLAVVVYGMPAKLAAMAAVYGGGLCLVPLRRGRPDGDLLLRR